MQHVPCRTPPLVAFFIAGIIPVFDNVFPDENARHETGHFCFYQREPNLTDDLFIIQRNPLPFVQSRAMHMAMPMPPPMHSVARPFLASRFCISCSNVTSTRAPDAPTGWPIAIAPPLTLTLEVSQPRSLLTAQACAAKASLASIRSRSPMLQPAFFSAAREAGIGPVPMILGSTPAWPHETIRPSTFLPSLAACFAVISTTAAAPSLIPEALPAVTVPSFSNAGLSLAIESSVAPWRGYSSVSTTMSPLRDLMVTGTISSLNLPAFCAASALFCEPTENSSCCERVIWYCRATFSAVLPMW